jgi:HEAT repeat protein
MNCRSSNRIKTRFYALLRIMPLLSLGWINSQSAIAQLPMPSPTPDWRREASPKQPPAPTTAPQLLDKLRTADGEARAEILATLKSMGRPAVKALITALDSPDPLVRSGALQVLGELREAASEAVPSILPRLNDDRRAIVPEASKPQDSPTPRFVDPLPLASLPPSDLSDPFATRPEPRPIWPLANPRHIIKFDALNALGQIGPTARIAATPLVAAMLKDGGDPQTRLHAAWTLTQMGADTPVLAIYLEGLTHPDRQVSQFAASAIYGLGQLSPKVIGAEATADTANTLVAVLGHPEEGVQMAAIAWLKVMGQDAVPALTKTLQHPKPNARLKAADLLGELGQAAQNSLPDLARLLTDPANEPQPQSLPPLTISPPLALPVFEIPPLPGEEVKIPPPGNPDRWVKIAAVVAMGKISKAAGLSAAPWTNAIQPLLQDRNPRVRLNAAWSLYQMGATVPIAPTYIEALSNPNLREIAVQFLAQYSDRLSQDITPAMTANLITLLGENDRYYRGKVQTILSNMGSTAVPSLIQALGDRNPLIRLETAKTLAQIGAAAQPAIPALTNLLQDSSRYSPPPAPPNPFGDLSPILTASALPALLPSAPGRLLIVMPQNPENLVRAEAIAAIAAIGTTDTKLLRTLETMAVQDNSPWVRLRASAAVMNLNGNLSILLKPLNTILQTGQKEQRSVALNLLNGIGVPAQDILLPYYLNQLQNSATRTDAVLWFGRNQLGVANLAAVPQIRSFLTGNDQVLRGYSATILADIAEGVWRDAQAGKVSPRQWQQAIKDFSQALTIVKQPNARFNREPVDRLESVMMWLKENQPNL